MKLIVKIFLISSLLVIAACSEAETISFESSEAIEVRNEPGTDDSIDLDEFEKEMEEMNGGGGMLADPRLQRLYSVANQTPRN